MRIAVLATGVGNVRSVVRALEHSAHRVLQLSQLEHAALRDLRIEPTRDPDVVRHADVLVVPGQGSFGAFAAALSGGSGLDQAMLERIRAGSPYLGICLGLQILFEDSEEAPGARGLGVLRGSVRRLAPGVEPGTDRARPLPHVGWNRVEALAREASAPGWDVVAPDHYYFAHSYAAVPLDPLDALATTEYGPTFTSAVAKGNIVGVQFHPEKSQRAGLALLERFFAGARARLSTRGA